MEKLNYRCCLCNKLIKDVVIKLSTSMHGRDKVLQEFFCHGACFHQKVHENYFLNLHEEPNKTKDIIIEETENYITYKDLWKSFINKLDSLEDSLITGIFKQAIFLFFSSDTKKVYIEFSKDFEMFSDVLLQAKKHWEPLLQESFLKSARLVMLYRDE